MSYNRVSRYQTKVQTFPNDSGIVAYHGTPIVVWTADSISLNHAGWQTVTTKRKMNQTAHEFGLGFGVYQKAGQWFVTTPQGDTLAWEGGVFSMSR